MTFVYVCTLYKSGLVISCENLVLTISSKTYCYLVQIGNCFDLIPEIERERERDSDP